MTAEFPRRRIGDTVMVRLTQKLADIIDGVNLSGYSAGDTARFPAAAAALLIAEGWAERVPERQRALHNANPRVATAKATTRAVQNPNPPKRGEGGSGSKHRVPRPKGS